MRQTVGQRPARFKLQRGALALQALDKRRHTPAFDKRLHWRRLPCCTSSTTSSVFFSIPGPAGHTRNSEGTTNGLTAPCGSRQPQRSGPRWWAPSGQTTSAGTTPSCPQPPLLLLQQALPQLAPQQMQQQQQQVVQQQLLARQPRLACRVWRRQWP